MLVFAHHALWLPCGRFCQRQTLYSFAGDTSQPFAVGYCVLVHQRAKDTSIPATPLPHEATLVGRQMKKSVLAGGCGALVSVLAHSCRRDARLMLLCGSGAPAAWMSSAAEATAASFTSVFPTVVFCLAVFFDVHFFFHFSFRRLPNCCWITSRWLYFFGRQL